MPFNCVWFYFSHHVEFRLQTQHLSPVFFSAHCLLKPFSDTHTYISSTRALICSVSWAGIVQAQKRQTVNNRLCSVTRHTPVCPHWDWTRVPFFSSLWPEGPAAFLSHAKVHSETSALRVQHSDTCLSDEFSCWTRSCLETENKVKEAMHFYLWAREREMCWEYWSNTSLLVCRHNESYSTCSPPRFLLLIRTGLWNCARVVIKCYLIESFFKSCAKIKDECVPFLLKADRGIKRNKRLNLGADLEREAEYSCQWNRCMYDWKGSMS